MNISGIQSQNTYTALSSGYKINSAADNAAGLAISEKLLTQTNGYDVGSSNAKDGVSLINVADGALSGIQDSLQRIHELGVRASNGLYSASDKQAFQTEIDGLKCDENGDSDRIHKLIDYAPLWTEGLCHSLGVYKYPKEFEVEYESYTDVMKETLYILFSRNKITNNSKGFIKIIDFNGGE